MAFDGGFLYKVLAELRTALDCHIDKIYQPSREELVFLLRKKGFAKRLYINIHSGSARIHFTNERPENPETPPNFCMLLRKYISSARLVDITQPDLERVAELHFSAANEMGDTENYRLVCELIGNMANVILVRQNGKIVDALRHSDVETAKRLILPNADYEYPANDGKLNPLKTSCNEILKGLEQNELLDKQLLSRIQGFSPLVCREIAFKTEKMSLSDAYSGVVKDLKTDYGILLSKADGSPADFSFTDISQYGNSFEKREFSSVSELLDSFYAAKERAARINAAARDVIRLVKNLYNRTQKKLSFRLNELENCKNRETFRIYGELLKANLYRINNGDSVAVVENYYDENLARVEIPLNPALSPAKNAERYFKEYKKTYTAANALTALTRQDRQELIYFESVLDSIERCTTVSEIGEIREELALGGYIRRDTRKTSKQKPPAKFLEYKSAEGYRILVGKNNIQNDYLTTKLAAKGDVWFHTKDIAGSHVIVMCGGNEISDETITFAATLAAQNSKAAASAQVPVDYTPVKYVKKPNGAKPGMVIYTTNKTVFINPCER